MRLVLVRHADSVRLNDALVVDLFQRHLLQGRARGERLLIAYTKHDEVAQLVGGCGGRVEIWKDDVPPGLDYGAPGLLALLGVGAQHNHSQWCRAHVERVCHSIQQDQIEPVPLAVRDLALLALGVEINDAAAGLWRRAADLDQEVLLLACLYILCLPRAGGPSEQSNGQRCEVRRPEPTSMPYNSSMRSSGTRILPPLSRRWV